MEGVLFPVSIMCLLILLLIFLLKKLKQPYPVAYILAGFLLGPGATGVFKGPDSISALGEIGVLLLMFFLGMGIEIPDSTLFRFVGNPKLDALKLMASIGGCVLLFLLLRSIRRRNLFQLPIWKEMERDHDLQVFTGACICLGFALLAAEAGLSAPVGSTEARYCPRPGNWAYWRLQ